MRWINGLIMSLGMFSAIPMPRLWDEKARNLIIPALPLVGLVIGSISFTLAWLIRSSPLALVIQAVLVLLIPLLLTGFIHVDGLMDTADAVFSRADTAKKLAILKDPHVGSFAIVAFCIVILIQLSAVYTLLENASSLIGFIFIPVISRSVTSLFVLNIPAVLTNGYAKSFREKTRLSHTVFLAALMLAALALSFRFGDIGLLAVLLIECLSAGISMRALNRTFKGISGDLSGFVLVVSETAALLALAIQTGGI